MQLPHSRSNKYLKIELNKKYEEITKNIDFAELCITSKAEVVYNDTSETNATANRAEGSKCSMCWKIKEEPCERDNCAKQS